MAGYGIGVRHAEGHALGAVQPQWALHKILDGAGMPRQGIHSFRHCCATLALAQGVSPRVVIELLGHSQISLTMDTYSHVMPVMLQDAARAMDSLLASAQTT